MNTKPHKGGIGETQKYFLALDRFNSFNMVGVNVVLT